MVGGGRARSGRLRNGGDIREDRDDRACPGPRLRNPEATSVCAVSESGGHVEESVAQRLRLAGCQRGGVADAAEQAGPRGQVDPGWGRSRRTITRIPAGHLARTFGSMRPVSSATSPPSRTPPSASSAGVQTFFGTRSMASRSFPVIANPTLYSTLRPRPVPCSVSQSSSPWDEPAPSERMSSFLW